MALYSWQISSTEKWELDLLLVSWSEISKLWNDRSTAKVQSVMFWTSNRPRIAACGLLPLLCKKMRVL